jgi:hypothetical protein
MSDNSTGLDQTEQEILSYDVSDDALEAAAGIDQPSAFTLGACTGLSVCPS